MSLWHLIRLWTVRRSWKTAENSFVTHMWTRRFIPWYACGKTPIYAQRFAMNLELLLLMSQRQPWPRDYRWRTGGESARHAKATSGFFARSVADRNIFGLKVRFVDTTDVDGFFDNPTEPRKPLRLSTTTRRGPSTKRAYRVNQNLVAFDLCFYICSSSPWTLKVVKLRKQQTTNNTPKLSKRDLNVSVKQDVPTFGYYQLALGMKHLPRRLPKNLRLRWILLPSNLVVLMNGTITCLSKVLTLQMSVKSNLLLWPNYCSKPICYMKLSDLNGKTIVSWSSAEYTLFS